MLFVAVRQSVVAQLTTSNINPLRKKATIHQFTSMLATSINALFPGPNYPLTTSAVDVRVIIKVKGHQHWWLASGYDLEIGHF